MKKTLTIICVLLSPVLFGQGSDLDFIAGKIRTAYAGFAVNSDTARFGRLVEEVRGASSGDSFASYSRVANYFKDDHLKLFQVVTLTHRDSVAAAENSRKIVDWEKGHNDMREGYWLDDLGNCVLFVHKDGEEWRGYVVETKDKEPAGLEVLRMTKEVDGEWEADYKDMNGQYRVITTAEFRGARVLVGRSYFKFRKCDRYMPGMLAGKPSFSYEPSITALDSETVVFRMPYFAGYLAKKYDSLVKANSAMFSRARTLIIDVRGNPGGSVRCFLPLLPFICTGLIREVYGYQLCSQDMIDDQRKNLAAYEKAQDTARANRTRRFIDTLLTHNDSLLLTGGREFPCQAAPNRITHVAVLMDHGSRSAAELLMLYFRQSKKVKFFGENSGGAVDFLDELSYWLPQTHFQMWVASTRRKTSAGEPAYDGHGIPPDVTIGEEVSDWVEWVRRYYAGRR